jgi:superfamily II DNA or RNA helicase
MSVFPFSEEIEHLFTFESAFGDKINATFIRGDSIYVPREAVPVSVLQDRRTSTEPFAISCNFQPRHEQGPLCEKSIAYLKHGKNHVFEAPTGWGKTIAGSYIAIKMGQPTLIVVTKDDLVKQWRHALINVLGVPESDVGLIQQDECNWKGKKFVIGMVQSLIIPNRYPSDMYGYFGMLILDEVHMMAADCFIRVCQTFPALYRLGFSATPERKDGKTKLLSWHIGPTLVRGSVVSMAPKVFLRRTGWKVPYKSRWSNGQRVMEPIPHSPGRMMGVIKEMGKCDVRNQEIVTFVKQAFDAGRHCVVLADLKEHLESLFFKLTSAGIPGNDIGYYVGGMSDLNLSLSKKKRVVLGTYKMCSTGTDVPQWDALVLATPHADVKQAVGRVLRFMEGKKQPIVLDLIDDSSLLQNFHMSRMKQYKSIGATIVSMG